MISLTPSPHYEPNGRGDPESLPILPLASPLSEQQRRWAFGERMLGGKDVEWSGGSVPDGRVAVHVGVVDEGALFCAGPAGGAATSGEEDVHSGWNLDVVVESVCGKGEVGILDGGLADDKVPLKTQTQRALVLQKHELLRR